MDALQALAEKFLKFPGVGPRQAKRFVYHILSRGPAEIAALEGALAALKKASAQCPRCFRFIPIRDQRRFALNALTGVAIRRS